MAGTAHGPHEAGHGMAPFAGVIQIRFDGCDLSPALADAGHPGSPEISTGRRSLSIGITAHRGSRWRRGRRRHPFPWYSRCAVRHGGHAFGRPPVMGWIPGSRVRTRCATLMAPPKPDASDSRLAAVQAGNRQGKTGPVDLKESRHQPIHSI